MIITIFKSKSNKNPSLRTTQQTIYSWTVTHLSYCFRQIILLRNQLLLSCLPGKVIYWHRSFTCSSWCSPTPRPWSSQLNTTELPLSHSLSLSSFMPSLADTSIMTSGSMSTENKTWRDGWKREKPFTRRDKCREEVGYPETTAVPTYK